MNPCIIFLHASPEITDQLGELSRRWIERRNALKTIDPSFDTQIEYWKVNATNIDELTNLLPAISDALMTYSNARKEHRSARAKTFTMVWRLEDAEMAAGCVYWSAMQQTVHALIKRQRVALTVASMSSYQLSEDEMRIVYMLRNEEYERAIIAIENLIGKRDYAKPLR